MCRIRAMRHSVESQLRAVRHSAESRLCAMPNRLKLKIEYLREYEFIFEIASTHKSGGP
jgi:hypothetical protein